MTSIPSPQLVTIFGGSGFLGRHITRALANDGWRIRIAVRYPHSASSSSPWDASVRSRSSNAIFVKMTR